ncbi:MAG: hypothetical protein KF760_28740 [Candidatus Eremiobacteraeota bacterium]|nr:hypothetical protein [Candidatus Eremiobacteraeota bacterium]MCW5865884.1 hypothetical protein [Candidatus Eremiobacteraeota bacterium]
MAYDHLGELQETRTMSRRFLFSAFFLWLGTLVAFFYILHLLFTPAAIAYEQRRAATIVCGMCGLGSLIFGWALAYHRGARLRLFSEGLELYISGHHYRFRWEDVEFLTLKVTARTVNGIRAATVHEYTLHLADGRKVAIPSGLRDLERLGQRLEREVYPRAASRAFERLRRNESVCFGPCKISNQGLEMSGTLKNWKELEPITLSGGIFTVRKRGGQTWRVVPFSDIPNAPVFLQLTQSLRQAS